MTSHIRDVITYKLEKQFEHKLTALKENERERMRLKLHAISAALQSLLSNWIESNMALPVDEMVEMSAKLVDDNLSQYL